MTAVIGEGDGGAGWKSWWDEVKKKKKSHRYKEQYSDYQGEGEGVKGGYIKMEGDLISAGEHTIQYTVDVL